MPFTSCVSGRSGGLCLFLCLCRRLCCLCLRLDLRRIWAWLILPLHGLICRFLLLLKFRLHLLHILRDFLLSCLLDCLGFLLLLRLASSAFFAVSGAAFSTFSASH